MKGLRLPRKRRFQVGGATPSTFGPQSNPVGMTSAQLQQMANQATAANPGGPTAAQNLGMMGLGINPFTGMSAGATMSAPGVGAGPGGQTGGPSITPIANPGLAAIQQGQMGAAGAQGAPAMGIPGAPTNAAISNAITNPQAQAAFQNFRNQFGGGMPQGAAGMGAGMGAGPGQAGAGPAGNLAALRAAMMRQRGAMAAPGAAGGPSGGASQWAGIGGPAGSSGFWGPGVGAGAGAAGGGVPAANAMGAAPMMGLMGGFKRGGKVGKKAAGGELEGDTPPVARVSNWRARQWGERDRSASDLPPKAERKARGGVIAKRPKGPPKVSIAVGISKRKPLSTPSPFDYDAQEESGSAAPGMARGGKWIQGAIKHPGALHKQLGVPQGEKIPAKKLNAAAEKGGTVGRRARLAKTLGKLGKREGGKVEEECKARGGRYEEEEREERKARGGLFGRPGRRTEETGKSDLQAEKRRPPSGGRGREERRARGGLHTGTGGGRPSKFDSTSNLVKAKKLAKGPGGRSLSFAAGGAAKERKGFPNTIAPPKRLAKGGKVRGTGIAQRGTHFSGIF